MTLLSYFNCYDMTSNSMIKLNSGQNVVFGKCFEFECDGLVVLNQIIYYVS